ncbi:MFS transporter [Aquabacterium sp. OR-4]|uniref:MFS transporter n=1 Tax=Aquabacterium sp. OR-4 TaxID=2978127 RepID=UPI0021B3DEA3|nr:MFS transporter [Aquabacterium sp. OR-4]MDT7834043.1 MFS transporter [Aquabacterium sp. OR-4]
MDTAKPAPARPAAATPSALDGLRYGALGAPLAFVALPLYLLLPGHYAAQLGVPLAGLGLVLLATRAADALVDPWLGRLADRALAAGRRQALGLAGLGALLLGCGFVALYFPAAAVAGAGASALLAWCAAALVITYAGYSALGVLHQAWGTRLGGDLAAQSRWTGWREGLALAGVIGGSVLPGLAGIPVMVGAGLLLLALGLAALGTAPYHAAPLHAVATGVPVRPAASWLLPWHNRAFRCLLAVFVLNGVASAVPATLVLFFVRDRLQAPALEPLFLGSYFAAAALALPLWVRAVARFGAVRCWGAGMALAVAVFAWAARLGPGDSSAFAAVCIGSGLALGADLAVPGALLAEVIRRAGHGQRHEGRYIGWWHAATKLNLALAAGLALPALQWAGYAPGSSSRAGLEALTLAYAALPCLVKLCAAAALWQCRHLLEPR